MGDIELVIKIPEEIYQHYKRTWSKRRGSIPESCIAFGIPLPKGHGRIIDESQISSAEYHEEIENIGTLFERIHPIIDSTDAPTIIEADTGETE